MKTIMLLRHAEAVYPDNGRDFDRVLAQSGKAYIRDELAPKLVAEKLIPDFVLCSPALRTKETLTLLLPHKPAKIDYIELLYNGTAGGYYESIKRVPENVKHLLLVGHNPSIHELAVFLTDFTKTDLGSRLQYQFSPGTLAVFSGIGEKWQGLQPGSNKLTRLIYP